VLGWTASEAEDIVFYNVGSVILSLYPHEASMADMGVTGSAPVGDYHGFALALNLGSRTEVDDLFAELAGKGVRIVKRPHEVFWGGYSGYFADVDGHAWEVAHNPFWALDEKGRPVAPGGEQQLNA
jgi:catechol 2,3-dioxygenase-like lactoylglutathione lyase family enzyme